MICLVLLFIIPVKVLFDVLDGNSRGWERCVPGDDINYFINVPAPVPVVQDCPEYRTFTFYVFYPNNYSGRNDAPVVSDAKVHSMDYLAGGIFTQ